MNCERAQEAYLAELAGEPADAVARVHLASCAACREATQATARMWAELGRLPEAPVPVSLRAKVAALAASTATRPIAVPRSSWRERLRDELERLLPSPGTRQLAGALALLVLGLGIGAWWERVAHRDQIAALRDEVQSTRALVAMSLLQQRSPAERLQGVTFSAEVETPDRGVVEALLETLDRDSSVDVRLATVEALSSIRDLPQVRDGLIAALGRQTSPLVQIEIIDALVSMRERRATPALNQIAADSQTDDAVRDRAEWAVRRLGS